MSDYLHYWTPQRAQRAFGDQTSPVLSLDNGWFKSLSQGDTLWILTKTHAELRLVFRGELIKRPRLLESIPMYAVGNSQMFFHHRAYFDAASADVPRGIPFGIDDLKRLRFYGRSSRVSGALNPILVGPLASMRRLQESSVSVLEAAWKRRSMHPWEDLEAPASPPQTAIDLRPAPARRRLEVTLSRVVRDTTTVAALKALHRYRCQICGTRLSLSTAKYYCEGHHLRPIGGVHEGPDIAENILVVCPNHHALLDFAALEIDVTQLRTHPRHRLGRAFVAYHNGLVRGHRNRVT